jgi:hypothetical protein
MTTATSKAPRPSLAGSVLPGGPVVPYPDKPLWRPRNIAWWAERLKDEPDESKKGWEEVPQERYPGDFPRRCLEIFDKGGDVRLVVGPDGEIYAAEASGSRVGRSTDGGRTWSELAKLPPFIESLGALRDGSVLASITVQPPPPSDMEQWWDQHALHGIKMDMYCSTDGCRTWMKTCRLEPPARLPEDIYEDWDHIGLGTGFSRFVQLRDGSVIVPVATNVLPTKQRGRPPERMQLCTTFIYRSTDGGLTWKPDPKPVGIGWGEFNVTLLRSGRLMAFIRLQRALQPEDPPDHWDIEPAPVTRGYKTGFMSTSDDDGRTWSPARMLTRYHEVPGCFVELSDGTLVASYGQKCVPYGCRAIVSPNGGKSWHQQILVLADQENDRPHMDNQGGHCCSVVLADDTIISAYQSQGAGEGVPMTSRAVIWRVPEELRAGKGGTNS